MPWHEDGRLASAQEGERANQVKGEGSTARGRSGVQLFAQQPQDEVTEGLWEESAGMRTTSNPSHGTSGIEEGR